MERFDVVLFQCSYSSASNVSTVSLFALESRDVETFGCNRVPSNRFRKKTYVSPVQCGSVWVREVECFVTRMGSQGNPACKKSSAVEEAIFSSEAAVLHHVET